MSATALYYLQTHTMESEVGVRERGVSQRDVLINYFYSTISKRPMRSDQTKVNET